MTQHKEGYVLTL